MQHILNFTKATARTPGPIQFLASPDIGRLDDCQCARLPDSIPNPALTISVSLPYLIEMVHHDLQCFIFHQTISMHFENAESHLQVSNSSPMGLHLFDTHFLINRILMDAREKRTEGSEGFMKHIMR